MPPSEQTRRQNASAIRFFIPMLCGADHIHAVLLVKVLQVAIRRQACVDGCEAGNLVQSCSRKAGLAQSG